MSDDTIKAGQLARAKQFQALHAASGTFVIPNPWDAGTTRLLTQMGFAALATTSAGHAFFSGQCDNTLGRSRILDNAREIVAHTHLPVSADLENGFGHSPDAVADTIRQAIDAGLAGGSIEDACHDPARGAQYPIAEAVARIRAAVEAVRASGSPFVLTARAENYLVGNPDLVDTVQRLQAYQEAGADVLYAPGANRRAEIATIVNAVDRPVNVVTGLGSEPLSLAELSALGVKRVSIGSALARCALGALQRACDEILELGRFDQLTRGMPYADISARLATRAPE